MSFGMYGALGISIIGLVGQLVKRPYLNNIRPAINCIFVASILGLYTLNKIFQDSESTSVYTSYTPFMLIGILVAALIFNIVCMIIHVVKGCRKAKSL
jgi:hypothetical protein